MNDINKYHTDIYHWYLNNKNEHKISSFTTYDEIYLCDEPKEYGDKRSYIITAIYVPADVVKVTIYIGDYSPIKLIWHEEEESLESILEQARTSPKTVEYTGSSYIDYNSYKRIVPVEPFICIPYNDVFRVYYGEDNFSNTYFIEYCKIPIYGYMPYPYNLENNISNPIWDILDDNSHITEHNTEMVDFLIDIDGNVDSLTDRDDELLKALKL